MSPATRRVRSKLGDTAVRSLVKEKHVQQAVTQFLELDGWRALRTDPVSDRGRGKGFGEEGMPDYLYVRYPMGRMATCWAHVLWIEFKAPGKQAAPHQVRWHARERILGANVQVVDNFDGFRRWYMTSGLNRKMSA